MSSDFTEQQSPADLKRSQELSLERTSPPTEVPGYEAQRFLGSGAYGEVWVGVDRNTGRKVAIKFYAHRRGVDWALLAREVEKLRFLSADRYVVQLLDVGWEAEPPYYVMEYVENGSLDDLLRRHGTFSVPEASEMFREIAVGLSHAHGKGVVHCDLKPANILLDQDHRPRLADFGQSRLSHEQKPALGTLFYMAPEQADLEASPDVRWDVYALGAILYTLLVGSPPHRNDAVADEMAAAQDLADRLARYRHAIRTAPSPAEHRKVPGVDSSLAEIIDRCLAVNPDDRFANVQEVLDALAARERAKERLPMLVLGFLGPLIVLLVTALFSWRGYSQAVQNAEAEYRSLAIENNKFAADLAAEKVAAEIGRYFELVSSEAEEAELRPPLFQLLEESQNLSKLSDPQSTDPEMAAAQVQFLNESSRLALDRYLAARLCVYQRIAGQDQHAPRSASIFSTDCLGTQIAAAHNEDVQSESIGKNFAHRTYFHGGSVELPKFHRPQLNARHITAPHLSTVFKSSTTKRWKVAIAAPIFREALRENLAGAGEKEFMGILVFTVNLGDFEFFRTTMSPAHDRFAVLVDGRTGTDAGTVLQHPLHDELLADWPSLPETLFEPQHRVPAELISGKGSEYDDPLGKFPDERGLAQRYARRWVAATSRVRSPRASGGNVDSGLVVLVQSDYQSVVEPARQLGQQFIKNSFWMLVVMAAVSLGLWYIVVRTFREPRAGLKRPATPIPESTPLHGMTTIAARRKP